MNRRIKHIYTRRLHRIRLAEMRVGRVIDILNLRDLHGLDRRGVVRLVAKDILEPNDPLLDQLNALQTYPK